MQGKLVTSKELVNDYTLLQYKYLLLEKALKQIEQMSDCGSYEKAIFKMKSIATDALKNN